VIIDQALSGQLSVTPVEEVATTVGAFLPRPHLRQLYLRLSLGHRGEAAPCVWGGCRSLLDKIGRDCHPRLGLGFLSLVVLGLGKAGVNEI